MVPKLNFKQKKTEMIYNILLLKGSLQHQININLEMVPILTIMFLQIIKMSTGKINSWFKIFKRDFT